MRADVQPYVFASMSPYVSAKRPIPDVKSPGKSRRCTSDSSLDSSMKR